tara:strand:- start:265 stop:1923 length:1659 start_codon:yes stop_codon:yes gene_type:complete
MAKKKLTANLDIVADKGYSCSMTKDYTDSFTIEQEFTNPDSFTTLSSFSKTIGQVTVANAKLIVLKNISNIAAEVAIRVYDWKDDSDTDITNNVDVGGGGATRLRTWTLILPAGDFYQLHTSRIVSYSPSAGATLESAANAADGNVEVLPSAINSGNEYAAVAGSTLLNEALSIGEIDTVAVDDSSYFKVNDLLQIGSEVMRVVSVGVNTLNLERGLLGSIEAAHSDDAVINFFFGNEHLAFDAGKCMSDRAGRFKQSGAFFSKGRLSADGFVDGVTAGTVAIQIGYTEGGYLDWGLSGITANTETGLAASTTYTFHLVADEYNVGGIDSVSTETAIAFTTDASDLTFAGSSNAVLPKIQAAIDEQTRTTSSGLLNKKVTIGLHNGDVRVTSGSNHSDTRIGIANVSGTTPFGVGRFPALASSVPDLLGSEHGGGTTDDIVFGPASRLPSETIVDPITGVETINKASFLLDDGNGNLRYMDRIVGSISYETGHCSWVLASHPEAEFKIWAGSSSAHTGGVSNLTNAINTIESISARSLNPVENTKLQLMLFG